MSENFNSFMSGNPLVTVLIVLLRVQRIMVVSASIRQVQDNTGNCRENTGYARCMTLIREA